MKVDEVEVFEKVHIQIKDIYSELSILSKKSPDGAINKFKLKFVNQVLTILNGLLGQESKPFPDFEVFDDDDIPTNSDVVFIISQYIQCLEKYKFDNIKILSGSWYWCLDDSDENIETTSPLREMYM